MQVADKVPCNPDREGVARTDAAIEAVWNAAHARTKAVRAHATPPTCAGCGLADWTVSITEPDGRHLHTACWKAEADAGDGAWKRRGHRLQRAREPEKD